MAVTLIDSEKDSFRLVALTHYSKEMFTQLASWLVESISRNVCACACSGSLRNYETLWNRDLLLKIVLLNI